MDQAVTDPSFIGELADLVFSEETLDSILRDLGSLAMRTIPEADAASTMVIPVEGAEPVRAWTDDFAKVIDDHQQKSREGPCLSAMAEQRVVRTDLRQLRAGWPKFMEAAEPEGLRGSLSAHLSLRGAVGSLNLYTRADIPFDIRDEKVIDQFAALAAMLLLNYELYAQRGVVVGQLHDAMESRGVIDMAKGVLMERDSLSPEHAFATLRRESQDRNVKLRVVAAELLESVEP